MNDRRLSDAQITAALRTHLPAQAQAGLHGRVVEAVEITSQQRPLPSFLGVLSDADPVAAQRSLLIAAALLLGLALASAAAVGAWQLLRRDTTPNLDLTPPADLPAFVLSTYDRMPDMPPVAITTLEDGSIKRRMYVDQSGAVRFDRYATPDAPEPDTYEIRNGTRLAQLTIVGSEKVWVEQDNAMTEDPRVYLLAEMLGGASSVQPGCGVSRNEGQIGDGTVASSWTYVGTDYVVGRPAVHVTCGGGDLWIDVATRLVLRSRGSVLNQSFQPVPGSSETIEVTDIEFGEQPADLFEIAQPAGVASMSTEAYDCALDPASCATPKPAPPAYTPPPGAIQGPLPPLPSSRASNGWIAYSTDGPTPGTSDITTGSDIYLVREGSEPRLIAGRQGGTTRNVCPVFSPDGSRLAFGVAGPQARTVVVLGLDANGVIRDPVSITVPGTGPAVCPRWSTDGKRIAYLLDDPTGLGRPTVVIRSLDGSEPTRVDGDPSAEDFGIGRQSNVPLLSPSGAWTVRVEVSSIGCELVVAKPNGTAVHIIPLSYCPYAIAAGSPDGRQVLLMEDVSGDDFTMHAIAVDSLSNQTIVSTVRTNGGRSWPGWGDVSWQPVFP